MRNLSDFINWVNKFNKEPIINLRKLGDVLSAFCRDSLGVTHVGILARDGLKDGMHLISVAGDVAKFRDLNWDEIESVEISGYLDGEKDKEIHYVRLYDDDEIVIVAVICCSVAIDNQSLEVLKCAARLVVDTYYHQKLAKRLAKSERIFNLTFEQVGSGRCVTDLDGYILEANHKFCEIIGYTQEEVIGLRIKNLTYPDDWKVDLVHKERLLKAEIPYFSMEKRYFRKDGSLVWVFTTVTNMKGEDGEDDFLIGIVQDISAQKSADIEMLTGLYNRRYMMVRLQEEFDRSMRSGSPFSLILTDIDYFKSINDTYGHECGDEVLKGLSKVLMGTVRSVDVLCRWGGEEFLILLPETDVFSARIIADRLRIAVESELFNYEENTFKLTMTFGVASLSKELTIKELIKLADQALYKGKALGRNIVV